MLLTWSPVGHLPQGLVSRDSASVTLTNGLHFPRCPNFQKNKISSFPCSGVVWCVLWTSQAINLYWIYHDNCRPPRWVNIKIYLPTTITRDFYHDHWQLRLSCQRLHLSPDSRTLSRASYCLCDGAQRMASVIFMPESLSSRHIAVHISIKQTKLSVSLSRNLSLSPRVTKWNLTQSRRHPTQYWSEHETEWIM